MSEFGGFPSRMEFTPVPNLFLNSVMPRIDNIDELRTVLYIFELVYRKKGSFRYTTLSELSGHPGPTARFSGSGQACPEDPLPPALDAAVKRGIILHLSTESGGRQEDLYCLNTEANRQALSRIQNGEMVLEGMRAQAPAPSKLEELPDIFALYEENIGMLTPLIAEEIADWKKNYPEPWIRDAIKEAVSLAKRSPRYIERILERWSSEGKGDGTYRGDNKKNTDPDKYIKGKYGHIVRRQ